MRIGLAGVGRIGAFHADTLRKLDGVDELLVADAVPEAARRVADDLGVRSVPDVDTLLDSRLDGLVIATATPSHAAILYAAVAAGVPTFCEKPIASSMDETLELAKLVSESSTPVHIGFQRRFDHGYRAAREAVRSGRLGFVHTIRANTNDQAPPDPAYIPTSGGIFRDCNVHDFDAIRFVTGRDVATVYATGGNKGAEFFAEAGDVDTGAAVLTLDDQTLALVSSTRYNGAGHDVRMEVMGSAGSISVGLDGSLALDSAEDDVDWPPGPRVSSFMDRFAPAYEDELAAFIDVAAGRADSPCTVSDALAAFEIADACERSKTTGRPVSIEQVDRP